MNGDLSVLFLGMIVILGGIISFFIGYGVRKLKAEKKITLAEDRAKKIVEEAKREADNRRKEVELEAKDLFYRTRTDFEKESKERRAELLTLEKRLLQREENLDRKVDVLEKKEKYIREREASISSREKTVKSKETELDSLLREEKERLQKISGLTAEGAKNLLLERIKDEMGQETALLIKRIEEEAKETADKKAKDIISLAIQRCAADHTAESTASVVNLPNDEMKGRIIGREGRNIRAFEIATGVDVVIDDTPEAVILSGFDMVKREIARTALERLILDGRIHPGRIEEVVAKVKKEMVGIIREEGEKASFDVGIHGLHPEEIKLLGKLKYRTSYGQNVLQHSKETSFLMGVMAGELGVNFKLARRIGLLHDLGKAVDHEVEGTHAKIGADLAHRYGESEDVSHAIEAHHQDIEAKTLFAVLVQAADAISATRPGARRETLESYIKRLGKLESIADSFKGVEKAYAIQAGREVRVIVQPNKINDLQAINLAREIRERVEGEMEYPGQVKVTVIRETRAIEYAK